MQEGFSRYFTARAKADGHKVEFASMGEFADTEPYAELIDCNPKGELCVIFESVTFTQDYDASSHYMQMLTCASNLKRNGAAKIWAMNPLAGFMRQDYLREGRMESLLSELSGRLMREAGFVGMSTVERHSEQAIENYEVGLGAGNVLNINPNEIIFKALKRMGIQVSSVANPDLGSDERAGEMADMFGVGRFKMEKERDREGSEIVDYHGQVAGQTLLIDDIAGTLKTAKDAIELIYDQGSKNNTLVISHAVMTGQAWDHLAKLIKKGKLDHVLFLPTFSRDAEYSSFAKKYGPDVADKVSFLEDKFYELIYDHVTQEVANHPAMKLEAA